MSKRKVTDLLPTEAILISCDEDLKVLENNSYVNKDGVILKAGMKVTGFITYQRSYMRTADKSIAGTIVSRKGRLYVNSDSEPDKNYHLSKFAHNWLTESKVAWLEII